MSGKTFQVATVRKDDQRFLFALPNRGVLYGTEEMPSLEDVVAEITSAPSTSMEENGTLIVPEMNIETTREMKRVRHLCASLDRPSDITSPTRR